MTLKEFEKRLKEVDELDEKIADIDQRILKLKTKTEAMDWKKRNKLYFEIGKYVYDHIEEAGPQLRLILDDWIKNGPKRTV